MNKATSLQRQSIDVQFLQKLLNRTNLELKISSLNEQRYRSIVLDDSSMTKWLNSHHVSCSLKRNFHININHFKKQPELGTFIGVYDSRIRRLHPLFLEPLKEGLAQEITDRLMSMVTYIALYFLSTYPNSAGVYIVDPPKTFLSNYGLYGYKVLDYGCEQDTPVMFGTFESLYERQQDVLFEMLLDHELDLLVSRKQHYPAPQTDRLKLRPTTRTNLASGPLSKANSS
ncbi:hypothetical protein [Vibrio neptunius]|uniref:hypothetical protein n=1 Tax=Vibrio neptunius TaxID=170651 RepID=UPI0019D01E60|nr:hypothetical protein [Vibrio neptunius]MBN3572068.1 hypothetical protein [Vibrio neptunius]QXX08691.1 hypothetical protein KW548_24275 [Vibrio neptunius]